MATRVMNQINPNPASAIQLRSFITASEHLDRDIALRRQQLRDDHRAREARLIAENNRQLEAAEEELDNESDQREQILYSQFESSLAQSSSRLPLNRSTQSSGSSSTGERLHQTFLLDAEYTTNELEEPFVNLQVRQHSPFPETPYVLLRDDTPTAMNPQNDFISPDSRYGSSLATCVCNKATLGENGICRNCHRHLDDSPFFS